LRVANASFHFEASLSLDPAGATPLATMASFGLWILLAFALWPAKIAVL